jgi:hypothetical protein
MAEDFSSVSETGVIGDPTKGSFAAGEEIWDLCLDEGCRLVLSLLSGEIVRERWHFQDSAEPA